MDKDNRFLSNLKAQAEANPIAALAVGAAVLTGLSKIIDANTARTAAKTHQLEISRRMLQTARR